MHTVKCILSYIPAYIQYIMHSWVSFMSFWGTPRFHNKCTFVFQLMYTHTHKHIYTCTNIHVHTPIVHNREGEYPTNSTTLRKVLE